jgi:nucleoside-diphosphate-sugar epimerase
MKALVTGASGFIGSHIVEALERQGHRVFALVRPTSDTSHLKRTRAELVLGDVTDRDSLVRACRGVDCVFHAAAVLFDAAASWPHYHEVGVQGTRHMVEAAVENRVSRFIHFSSMVVYGTRTRGRRYSEDTPLEQHPEPWNHYVREKVLSEQVVLEAQNAARLCATRLRPSIVIGPRDRTILPRLLRLLRPPFGMTIGNGSNRVPFVVVEELAALCVAAAQTKEAEGKCYNLSGREVIRQCDIMNILAETAGLPKPRRGLPKGSVMALAGFLENVWRLPGLKGEPPFARLAVALGGEDWDIDCSRARRELGWVGNSDYKSAVERFYQTYRETASDS